MLFGRSQQFRVKSTTLTAINRLVFDFGDRTLNRKFKEKIQDPARILSQLEQGISLKSLGLNKSNEIANLLKFYLQLGELKNNMEIRLDEDKFERYDHLYKKIEQLSGLKRKEYGSWDVILFQISKKLGMINNLIDIDYDC